MLISVLNYTDKSDAEVQEVIRAVNRQITEDFAPLWDMSATLRLDGKTTKKPTKQHPVDMRGEAILYLWDGSDVKDALGYHEANASGIPYGFVFTKLSEQYGEDWRVTLSHEALELIADPYANLLVMGPHPEHPTETVFHWYEMCDAVQGLSYKIDGIPVSDFVLPYYFTDGEEHSRNDFLGTKDLKSFGVTAGGYIGFFDPKKNDMVTYESDKKASKRLETKRKALRDVRGSGRFVKRSDNHVIRSEMKQKELAGVGNP